MSGHIWIINVEGIKSVNEAEILRNCKELGIQVGVNKKDISAKNQAQELLIKNEKLSWASFNIEGCFLTVNIRERINNEVSKSTNLKAKADGIITKIDITSGNCVVKIGDTVKKGDLLVSGIIEGNSGTEFVRSSGKIYADVKEIITLEQKFKQTEKIENGKISNKFVLEFFTLKIPLYLGSEKGDFSVEYKTWQASLFDKKLPIKIHTAKFCFLDVSNIEYNEDQLRKILKAELENKTKNATVESEEFTKTESGLILKAIIAKTEEITYQDELIFSIGNP